MNIVPTAHTRRIAQRMADDAAKDDDNSPADVVIEWLHRVEPGQYPALVGLLLGYTLRPEHPGVVGTYTQPELMEAHRRHTAGERGVWVEEGGTRVQPDRWPEASTEAEAGRRDGRSIMSGCHAQRVDTHRMPASRDMMAGAKREPDRVNESDSLATCSTRPKGA